MRSKKFASSSKTPKISNRIDGTPPFYEQSFITTRNRRLRLDGHTSPFRLGLVESVPASSSHPTDHHNLHEATKKRNIVISDSKLPSSFTELKPVNDPNEEMDLGSDDEELMSPDGPPAPPTPVRQVPPFRSDPNARENIKPLSSQKDHKERFQSFLSLPIGTPPDPQGPHIAWRHSPPPHQRELTNAYLQEMRKAPADDPEVFSRILRSDKHAWLGSEIGGDNLHQEESLDGSEITQSTITDAAKKRPRRSHLMPSFEPREPPKTHPTASSAKKPGDVSDPSDDMLEEYSLPDQEVNRETEIVVGGKHYIHRKLDPGWVVKVSTTQNRPYYVHPDFGTTWQCPNSLPPKSKARTFRRSSVTSKPDRNLDPLAHDSRKPCLSPEHSRNHRSEDLGTMSDLIKGWKKQQTVIKNTRDGYDASVSCNESVSHNGTNESDVAFSNDPSVTDSVSTKSKHVQKAATVSSLNSEEEETPEWITPMRAGIATPQSAGRRGAHPSKNKASTPHLSPIVEDDSVSPPPARIKTTQEPRDVSIARYKYDSKRLEAPRVRNAPIVAGRTKTIPGDRESESDKSTPRVSFERFEVDRRSSSHDAPALSDNFAERPVASIHHRRDHDPGAGTLILDAYEPTVDVLESEENRCELVVGSIHHSSRRNHHRQGIFAMNTPREFVPMKPSEPQDAPKKRQSSSFANASHHAKRNVEDNQMNDHENMVLEAKIGSNVKRHDHSEFQDGNGDEWSPMRHEEEQAPIVTQERRLAPPCVPSPGSNGFPTEDDFDFSSPSISNDEQTDRKIDRQIAVRDVSLPPKTVEHLYTHVVQSPLANSPAPNLRATPPEIVGDGDILSPPRLRHTLSSRLSGTADSPLSNSSGGNALECFEPSQADDYDHRPQSPERGYARPMPYNWRVTRPFYPICALQRIDELLKEQRKRQRKTKQLRGKSKLRKFDVKSQMTKHRTRKYRSRF